MKDPLITCALTGLLAAVVVVPAQAEGPCPAGFVHLGELYFSTNNENGSDTKTTALTPGFVPDQSYQQTSIKAAGGGSDARSDLTAGDVPAGFHLVMSGSESSCKGWSVVKPVSLTAVKLKGTTLEQFGFSAKMYCTKGSGETCKLKGGCDARVEICGKRAPADARSTTTRIKKPTGARQ